MPTREGREVFNGRGERIDSGGSNPLTMEQPQTHVPRMRSILQATRRVAEDTRYEWSG